MFKKDSLWIGIVAALFLPILFFVPVFYLTKQLNLDTHTQSFLFIIGVALNLIPMRIANAQNREQVLKGVLLVSFLYAIAFCILKYKGIA